MIVPSPGSRDVIPSYLLMCKGPSTKKEMEFGARIPCKIKRLKTHGWKLDPNDISLGNV